MNGYVKYYGRNKYLALLWAKGKDINILKI